MASLRSKVEAALFAAFDDCADNLYAGVGAEDKLLPCVIVAAKSSEVAFIGTGRHSVICEITVKCNAGSDTDFDTICAAVDDIVDGPTLATSLTTDDLFVYGLESSPRTDWGTDGDAWTHTRTIQIACAHKS